MKMKKRVRIFTAQLLCLILVTGILAGCQTKEEGQTTEKLNYSSSGIYSTTVALPEVTLSKKMTADDVQVYYYTMQSSDTETKEKVNQEQAEVKEIEVKGKHNLQVNFEDKKAAENATGAYFVGVKGQEGTSAFVPVYYDNYILECDREAAYPWEKKIQLRLTLTGTKFSDNITSEDLKAGGSFEGMEINLVSSGKQNLTVELTGDMQKNEYANAYLGGTVSVGRNGIENGYGDVSTVVKVEETSAGVAKEDAEIKEGILSLPILLNGGNFASEIEKESFSIDGLTIEQVERKNDEEVQLQVAWDTEAKSINQITELLSEKILEIKDDATNTGLSFSIPLTLSEASFYPVFDYVDEEEGKLVFTLILIPEEGTFSKDIKKEDFTLEEDFADGQIRSVNLQDDDNVEMIIELPAGDLSVDTMNLLGKVTATSGTMINVWGEIKESETSYARYYTQDSIGKGFGDAINTISETVEMLTNNPFYNAINSAAGVGSSITGAVKTGIAVLEYFGVVESEQSKQLKQLQDGVNKINDTLKQQNKSLDRLLVAAYKNEVTNFSEKLETLQIQANICSGIYENLQNKNVREKYGIEEPSAPFSDDLAEGDPVYQEWKKYNADSRRVILEGNEKNDPYFENAKQKFTDLEKDLITVISAMKRDQITNNPFTDYDNLCMYAFNFDASSYSYREAYRAFSRYVVDYGYSLLCAYYDVWNNPNNSSFNRIKEEYEKANAIIEEETQNMGERTNQAYCYVTNSYVVAEPFLVSDEEMNQYTKTSQILDLMKNKWQDIHNRSFITHMTEEQKETFENRMSGRTMDEEMTLLFSNLGTVYEVPENGTVCLFNMAKDSYQFETEVTQDNQRQFLSGYMDAEYVVMPTDFTGARGDSQAYENDPSIKREDLMIQFKVGDGQYYKYKALLNQ